MDEIILYMCVSIIYGYIVYECAALGFESCSVRVKWEIKNHVRACKCIRFSSCIKCYICFASCALGVFVKLNVS